MNQFIARRAAARTAHLAALVLVTLVAFAGVASAQSNHAKHGRLSITAPTEVGGIMLQPGEYEVRKANSAEGPVVEFVHMFHNEQASELVQADEEEVVAKVKFTPQALNTAPKQTQLQLASNPRNAFALEIRGDSTDYVFAPAEYDAQR